MSGTISVLTGPMRSRKTLDVIIKAMEETIALKKVVAFHPVNSSRWDVLDAIVSRVELFSDGESKSMTASFPSIPLPKDLHNFFDILVIDADVVIFDDAQFFGNELVSICKTLRARGIDVYVSGLDMDCFQQPFGPMPFIMSIADTVTKHTAICHDCQTKGSISYRITDHQEQELVGNDEYLTLCYDCWYARQQDRDISF